MCLLLIAPSLFLDRNLKAVSGLFTPISDVIIIMWLVLFED
jgi:hypothetical protein